MYVLFDSDKQPKALMFDNQEDVAKIFSLFNCTSIATAAELSGDVWEQLNKGSTEGYKKYHKNLCNVNTSREKKNSQSVSPKYVTEKKE